MKRTLFNFRIEYYVRYVNYSRCYIPARVLKVGIHTVRYSGRIVNVGDLLNIRGLLYH